MQAAISARFIYSLPCELLSVSACSFFFFNDTATTEIYTLSLHDALPISRTDRPRDELAIKLALALTTPGADVRAVVQTQRGATMRTLQEYTRLKARADQPSDLSWRLVLDAMLFQAEAEIRWLDHCEASLVRYTAPPATPNTTPAGDLAPEVSAR